MPVFYYRGLNDKQYHVEVHLRYRHGTSIHGIWNHNVGKCLGPSITILALGF